MPPEERWSGRWFNVDKVFAPLNLEEAEVIQVQDFFNIRSWEEYLDFMNYVRFNPLRKPEKSILFASSYNKVAEDKDEER